MTPAAMVVKFLNRCMSAKLNIVLGIQNRSLRADYIAYAEAQGKKVCNLYCHNFDLEKTVSLPNVIVVFDRPTFHLCQDELMSLLSNPSPESMQTRFLLVDQEQPAERLADLLKEHDESTR